MATASKTEAKPKATKSPIPKRILTRIEDAFHALEADGHRDNGDPAHAARVTKEVGKKKADVIAYIEELIAKSSG